MSNHDERLGICFHGTTILAVRRGSSAVMAGDGQVTLNNTIVKATACKVRRIYNGGILVGFAGATADAFNLYEKLEKKLERFNGNLTRAAVELAKDWRSDKYLRRLEALMIALDRSSTFLLSGSGDVIEPDTGVIGIGSGGVPAQAAATALIIKTDLSPRQIVETSMKIASSFCVFTNNILKIEEIVENE